MSLDTELYGAGLPAVRLQHAIDTLQGRVDQIDKQLDRLIAGETIGVGITADYLAVQLVSARLALAELRERAAKH